MLQLMESEGLTENGIIHCIVIMLNGKLTTVKKCVNV